MFIAGVLINAGKLKASTATGALGISNGTCFNEGLRGVLGRTLEVYVQGIKQMRTP